MFNTLAYAKKLEKAGVLNAQAETLAEAIDNDLINKQDVLNIQQSKEVGLLQENIIGIRQDAVILQKDLTNLRQCIIISQNDVVELKKDLNELKSTTQHPEVSLRHDMQQIGFRLEGKLAKLKVDLIKWFFGIFLILVGLMLSGVKLLH